MGTFSLVSIIWGSRNGCEARTGIMLETPRGIYEVYINAAGHESFMFNSRWMRGLPVDGQHNADTAALFKKFNEHKDDLQKYTITDDSSLWWELKEKISPSLHRKYGNKD